MAAKLAAIKAAKLATIKAVHNLDSDVSLVNQK